MKNNYEKVQQVCDEGYNLDFGNVFEKAFENYKNIAGIAGISILLMSIIFGVLIFGVVGAFVGFSGLTQNMVDFDISQFSGIYLIAYLIFASVISGISGSLNAGFYKMAHHENFGKEYGISTLFDYFKTPYFKELFIANLLIAFLTTGFTLLFEYINLSIIGSLITYIISFFTVLTIPLIIFSDIKAIDAIVFSCKLVLKSPLMLLGLLIVAVILAMLGLIGLCIGIFFTLPFIFSTVYSIYNEILPIQETNVIDEIGINENE